MNPRLHYTAFARVFSYPTQHYNADVVACAQLLQDLDAQVYRHFEPFVDFAAARSAVEMEEIFSKTFHIQAICYLDLGYVIWGEDYKRGEFLVHMKAEQLRAKNDCGPELPDNLACVLSLLDKTPDKDFRQELAVRILLPALDRMIQEFEDARIQLKERVLRKLHNALIQQGLEGGNVYRHALEALRALLKVEFRGVRYDDHLQQPALGGQFLKNCTGASCGPDIMQTPVKQDLSVGML